MIRGKYITGWENLTTDIPRGYTGAYMLPDRSALSNIGYQPRNVWTADIHAVCLDSILWMNVGCFTDTTTSHTIGELSPFTKEYSSVEHSPEGLLPCFSLKADKIKLIGVDGKSENTAYRIELVG